MKTWYVEKANLIHKLSEEELTLFEGHGTRLAFSKGEQLLPALDDDQSSCVYLLTSGYAKLLTMNEDGKRFSISILQAGDFLGNLLGGASQGDPDDEFLEMMSDVQLLRIDSERFTTVMSNNPTLYISVLQILQGKGRQVQRKLSDLLFKDVFARIAQLFLELTFTHGTECPYAFGLCHDLNLKHHEIAELIGASRPVTSMALGRFVKADLVHKHDGVICLNNIKGLKDVAANGQPTLEQLEKSFSSLVS